MNKKIILLSLMSCIFFIPKINSSSSSSSQNIMGSNQSSSSSALSTSSSAAAIAANASAQSLKCFFCHQKFKAIENRHLHHWDIHKDEAKFRCDQCETCFQRSSKLQRHLRTDKHQKKAKQTDPSSLVSASTSSNAAANAIAQTASNSSSSSDISYESHTLRCFFCPQEFKNPQKFKAIENRRLHHWDIHKDEAKFRCDQCETCFQRPSKLQMHLRTDKHQKKAKQTDPSSLVSASTSSSAAANAIAQTASSSSSSSDTSHESHTLRCFFCPQEFKNPQKFKAIENRCLHHWDTHKDEAKFRCDECETCFKWLPKLQMHLRIDKHQKKAKQTNSSSSSSALSCAKTTADTPSSVSLSAAAAVAIASTQKDLKYTAISAMPNTSQNSLYSSNSNESLSSNASSSIVAGASASSFSTGAISLSLPEENELEESQLEDDETSDFNRKLKCQYCSMIFYDELDRADHEYEEHENRGSRAQALQSIANNFNVVSQSFSTASTNNSSSSSSSSSSTATTRSKRKALNNDSLAAHKRKKSCNKGT